MRELLLVFVTETFIEHVPTALGDLKVLMSKHVCQRKNEFTSIADDSREVGL